MNDDLLAVLAVAAFLVIAALVVYWMVQRREISFLSSQQRLALYGELFDALTDLNRSMGDEYRLSRAKARLARALNRINLIAGPRVLAQVSELLDFQNQFRDREPDIAKFSALCNNLVIAIRKESGDPDLKDLQAQKTRFRFFVPPRR